jgi:hypothetical protein
MRSAGHGQYNSIQEAIDREQLAQLNAVGPNRPSDCGVDPRPEKSGQSPDQTRAVFKP